MASDTNSRVGSFFDIVCGFSRSMWLLFTMSVLMLVLSSFSLLFLDRNSESYTILIVDIVVLLFTLVAILSVLYRCSNRP